MQYRNKNLKILFAPKIYYSRIAIFVQTGQKMDIGRTKNGYRQKKRDACRGRHRTGHWCAVRTDLSVSNERSAAGTASAGLPDAVKAVSQKRGFFNDAIHPFRVLQLTEHRETERCRRRISRIPTSFGSRTNRRTIPGTASRAVTIHALHFFAETTFLFMAYPSDEYPSRINYRNPLLRKYPAARVF